MLREVKGLHGARIHAIDGEVGRVDEILFDDKHWTVRYLVVQTGSWLVGRKVLISPMAFGFLDWEQHTLTLNLTREQIENSPDVDTDKPVSRQWEREYYDFNTWPYYWDSMGAWGTYKYPGMLYTQSILNAERAQQPVAERAQFQDDANLRSTKEVTGYAISAPDGHFGHIQDFLLDDETWRICYLGVDTSSWLFGKKVLLPPDCIEQVNWTERSVMVNITRDQVQNAPEWQPGQPISPLFEEQLCSYYSGQHLE